MDPVACMDRIVGAWSSGDREEMYEGLRDLIAWYERGGGGITDALRSRIGLEFILCCAQHIVDLADEKNRKDSEMPY